MTSSVVNRFRIHEKTIQTRALRSHLEQGESSPPDDLILVRRALDHGQFAEAERRLRRALSREPESAEAKSLMGVVHERLGEHHSAYQCYRATLKLDRHDTIALAGLRRYCERFRLDIRNPAINPAATARP
jgi:Flp pilus assembly protein TadD